MVNPLLTNESLKAFIEKLNLTQEQKQFLSSQVEELGEEGRKELLNLLIELYFVDREEKEALEKLKKFKGKF